MDDQPYDPFRDTPPILYGTDGLDDISIEREFYSIFSGELPDAKVLELTELVKRLAGDPKFRTSQYAEKTGWLFQFARELMARFPPDERKGGGRVLAPFALLFAEEVSKSIDLPATDFDWNDREQVTLAFEAAWGKAKFAAGEGQLESAIARAKNQKVTTFNGTLSLVVSAGYWLSQDSGGQAFFLPVNDKCADLFGITKPVLSNCILAALDRDLFCLRKCAVPHKRARTFHFNLNHPDLLPSYR